MSPGVRWRSRRALESPALRRVRLPLLLSLRRRCRRVKGALGLGDIAGFWPVMVA